ncbi:MAG: hypothetical protein IKV94_04295 [Clostridia bacterium]|nr:hypothetical protein [Clostridia bacterium]
MATITNEAIDKLLDSEKTEESQSRYNKIASILNTENYIVTPKEIDAIIDKISEIIASGINEAV